MTNQLKTRLAVLRCGEVPEGYQRTKVGVVPEEWGQKIISDCLGKVEVPVTVEKESLYTQIGIRSHGKGVFHKEPVTGETLGNKSVYWIQPECFIVNVVFAWERAVGKTTESENGMIGSHRFPMYRPLGENVDIDYLLYYFMTKRGKDILEEASPGGAGRNRTLGQERFMKSKIMLPPLSEQQKIATILSTQDKLIELKEQLIAEKQQQKKYLMQQLLTGKKRLAGFEGEWKKYELGKIFDYEQPTPYLVSSTDYDDRYQTPVLTAGKTFILGYTDDINGIYSNLPVVIFDDFTTASKYVDFPFKAKSSAMKILKCNQNHNIVFAYAQLNDLHYPVGGHERHWISKFSFLPVKMPPLPEQQAIANILTTADREIELLQQELEQEKQKKKALMQLLLTGIVRVTL